MSALKPYAILFSSAIVTAYLFYVTIPVPNELQPSDEIFWIYLKKKALRAISSIGELANIDSHVNISRTLGSYSAFSSRRPPKLTAITVEKLHFGDIPVNLIKPKNYVDNGPAILWFHGGGWVYGSADSDYHFLEILCEQLNIKIFSVEYRLAPEHVYPEPLNDCYNAFLHLVAHSQEYNINPRRIALAGLSAGANLVAAVTLKLRDADFTDFKPQPLIQILLVPCLQALNFNTPSYQLHRDNSFLPQHYMINFWLWYALGADGHRYTSELISTPPSFFNKSQASTDIITLKYLPHKYIHPSYTPPLTDTPPNPSLESKTEDIFLDPYFSPLVARQLKGLPSAYIAVAEFDVLRDDGLMYHRRLVEAGGEVVLRHYEHSFHSLLANPEFESAKVVLEDLREYLLSKL